MLPGRRLLVFVGSSSVSGLSFVHSWALGGRICALFGYAFIVFMVFIGRLGVSMSWRFN